VAIINAGNLTLADLTARMDPSGHIAPIVELLTKKNAVLEHAVFKQGNLPTGHTFSSRTALPSVYFRKYNEGVPASKSRTSAVTESAGMLEGNSKVDVDLAELAGNEGAAFRLGEDKAFLQSFNNAFETAFFYSSTATNPEAPMGLAPRFNSKSTGPWMSQFITPAITQTDADQSSIWLVGWGDDTVYGFTPKGAPGGLTPRDMGKQLTKDDGGVNEFLAYVMNWNWKFGFAIQDYRYVVRSQVDMSAVANTGNLIIQTMLNMVEQLHDTMNCKPVFYVNRRVRTYLNQQALASVGAGGGLTFENVTGKQVLHFQGIPVVRTDALLSTESIVT
jgi:hypothetical protein